MSPFPLLPLPYYADSSTLPAPLPTVADIEATQDILSDKLTRRLVGVNTHYVVKYGPAVDLLEGKTQLFLQQVTSIPVPRVYAIFTAQTSGKNYIVMERIKGPTLASAWPAMSEADKKGVTSELRRYFAQMRKLESPGGYCSLEHGPLRDAMFTGPNSKDLKAGPFATETEWNVALVAKYATIHPHKEKMAFYKRVFEQDFMNHQPVFTHADFRRSNVMFRDSEGEADNTNQEANGKKLVIVGWKAAGWYPSYWEYTRAIFACEKEHDDWWRWVSEVLEPFRHEEARMIQFLVQI